MKKLNRLFYIFSFAGFLFSVNSCSNLVNPIEGIKTCNNSDSTKLYTISGKVELNGAVPQEVADNFFGTGTSAAGGTDARVAFPSVSSSDVSCFVMYKSGTEGWSAARSFSVNTTTHMFEFALPAGTYELKAQYKVNNQIVMQSSNFTAEIGEDKPRCKPVLKLTPVTGDGKKGKVKLKVVVNTAVFDTVNFTMTQIGDNEPCSSSDRADFSNGVYYINGDDIYTESNYLPYDVFAGQYIMNLYFFKDSKLVYNCSEVINVFNTLTTDTWYGSAGHIENADTTSSCITIDAADVAKYAMSNVYVDEGSQLTAARGTFQEPFTNLNAAINYIKSSAAAFDAGGSGTAPEYTIWLKSDVTIPQTQSSGYVFNFSKPGNSTSKIFTIRSYGSTKYTINCTNCSSALFTQQVISGNNPDYFKFNFKDLKFENYTKLISTCQLVSFDNCTLENPKSTNGNCDAIELLFFNSNAKGKLILRGETTFAENASIKLNGQTEILLEGGPSSYSPFRCNGNFIANVNVEQGQNGYASSSTYVRINDTIITDETGSNVQKFKITNFWYEIISAEESGKTVGKVIPHMYVSPDGTGDGSKSNPFALGDAIGRYNGISSNLTSSTPVTITLEKGEYSISSITSNLFADSVSNTNLTIEGAGKRTDNAGTKITIDCNPSAYSIVDWTKDSSKFTLKNLTIDGNDKQFGSSVFFFGQRAADKLISTNLENVEIIKFNLSGTVSLFEVYGNLSLKNVTIKNCHICDDSGDLSNCAIYYGGPVDGFTISGNNQIKDNYVVDNFTNPSKQNPANIYLAKSGTPSVQTYLTVTGSLAGSSIGVNMETPPTAIEPVVFTSGYTQNGNSISNIRTIFTGDKYTVLPSNDGKEGVLVTGGGTAKGDAIADNIKFELSHYVIDLSQNNYSSGYPAISFTAKCDGTDITNKLANCKMTVSSHTRELKSEIGKSITFNSSWYPDDYEITVEADFDKKESGKYKSYSAIFYVPIVKSDDLTYMSDDEPPTSGIYKIGTVAAINKIRTWTQSGNLPAGVTFELTNDIELPSNFAPISAYTTKFKASFNGNGHSLILNGASNCSSVFGYVQGASSINKSIIQNLTIKSKNSLSKNSSLYVFADTITHCQIINCVNECNVTVTSTSSQASGFVNSLGNYTVIKNCVNKGNIMSDGIAAGFTISTGDSSTISNCRNNGKITAKSSKVLYSATVSAAGISLDERNYVVNCCNTGDVTGPAACGGIVAVGRTKEAAKGIYNCYNSGNITSTASSAGGIAGCYCLYSNYLFLALKNCCNYGNITRVEKGAVIGNIGDGGTIIYENDFYLDGTAPSGAYDNTDDLTGINKKTLTQFNDSANGPISDLNNGGEADDINFAEWIIGPQGYPVLKF